MDRYSFEVWTLKRHEAVVRHAETRSRLLGWQPQSRLADLVASLLRRLADKLDSRQQQSPSSMRTT